MSKAIPDEGTCFFCMKRKGTSLFSLKNGAWPAPMKPTDKLLICDECFDLPADDKAKIVCQYVNALRRRHNQKIQAEMN